MRLSGCFTAMVTPLQDDGSVDYEGLRMNVSFQIEHGISGLMPLGTTGESPTIEPDERKRIIETVVNAASGRVPVYVGTGTYSTGETIRLSTEAQSLGAEGLLVVSPYYNKPTQEGLYRHFAALAESVEIPIVVYNIQGRTGSNIETPTLLRMTRYENITAVKEASGNVAQMMEVINVLPDGFSVLSGDDNLTLPLMALGGHGVISVLANLIPGEVSAMVRAALDGDFRRARELHYRLLPLFKACFFETNPIPIKTAMNMRGLPAGPLRLPMCEMQPQNREKLESVLSTLELV